MPSSTSSSNSTASTSPVVTPRRSPLASFAAAVGLALVLLFGWESLWRHRGFVASVHDAPAAWAVARARALKASSSIVLVGSSRFQLGLDPKVLTAQLAGAPSVFELAITGGRSLPVLQDLAEDTDFKGLAVVEVGPTSFFAPLEVASSGKAAEWVAQANALPFVSSVDVWLREAGEAHLVMFEPTLNPINVLANLVTRRRLPQPPYATMRRDRFRVADYTQVDVKARAQHWLTEYRSGAVVPTEAQFQVLLAKLRQDVNAIVGRGGRVVFVTMVTSGELYELEESLVPRSRYWDRMLREGPFDGIHFRDLPAAAGLQCPDGSHLDSTAAIVFSKALGVELKRRNIVP